MLARWSAILLAAVAHAAPVLAQAAAVYLGPGATTDGGKLQGLAGVALRFGRVVLRPELRAIETRDHGTLLGASGAVGLMAGGPAAMVRPYILGSLGYGVALSEGDETALVAGAFGITIGRGLGLFAEARLDAFAAARSSFYYPTGRRTFPGFVAGVRLGGP